MKIVVASTNPVKIQATETAFRKMFQNIDVAVIGISAPSEVADQPMSEEETLQGAMNRAENISKLASEADYWVGLEGGLTEKEEAVFTSNWVVIKSKEGKVGKGNTGSFALPKKIASLVKNGQELTVASEQVFEQEHVGQTSGTIGILTDDVLSRTSYYETAVILALIPFRHPELY